MEFFCHYSDVEITCPYSLVPQGQYIFLDMDLVLDVNTKKWGRCLQNHLDSLDVTWQDDTHQEILLTEDSLKSPDNWTWPPDGMKVEKLASSIRSLESSILGRRKEKLISTAQWILEGLRTNCEKTRDILYLVQSITTPPPIWKVTTPKGEENFISHQEPQGTMIEDHYYVFVKDSSGEMDVYRTQ